MNGSYAKGLKFKFFNYNIRIWSKGFEIDNNMKGRVFWFPWCKYFWSSK